MQEGYWIHIQGMGELATLGRYLYHHIPWSLWPVCLINLCFSYWLP